MKALAVAIGCLFLPLGGHAVLPASAYDALGTVVPEEKTHWLTTSSGVRHNSTCRYYRTSKGRPCGPDEGRACKICGG